jgi:acetyl-CoA synthetase
MAVRSLGRGVGRLLGSLRGRWGQLGWPQCSVSAQLRAASGPSGSAPTAAAATTPPGSYPALSAQAAHEPAAFWGPLARDTLVWDTPYHTVWDCDFSTGKIGWFLGGQLNVSGELAAGIRDAPNSDFPRRLKEPHDP